LPCGLVLAACGSQPAASSAAGEQATSPPAAATSAATTPASPAPTPTAPTSAPAACQPSALRISLVSTGSVAEQAGGYLRFENTSTATCRLSGYPAVLGVSTAGRSAAFGEARNTIYGAWTYTGTVPLLPLAPGQSAYAVVVGDAIPAGTATSCPAPFHELQVAPPGSSQYVSISAWLPGAGSYLPACPALSGASANRVSLLVPLSSLGH
jgi:Protein of unknown function (DUF4232)